MQIQELLNSKLEREYAISIPATQISEAIDNKAIEFTKTVKIDGFRAGKVPVSIIKQRYKENIVKEILDDLVNKTSQNIVSENKFRLATRPDINISSFEEGKNLEYKIKFELLPEIPEIDYSTCEIKEFICDISDKDMDQALLTLQKSKQILEKTENSIVAKNGDITVIDFTGYIDKKEFEGGKANNYKLELGSNQFIPGFESGIIGLKAGDTTTLDLKFPKDYDMKDFAGKKVVFEVNIREILHASLPKIDDELAKQFGMPNLEDLKKAIKLDLEKRYAKFCHDLMKKELLDILDKKIICDLPVSMVEQEFLSMKKQLSDQDQNEKDIDKIPADKYRKIAERRVKLGLFLSDIAEKNKLNITQEDIRDAITNYAQSMPGQENIVIDYFKNNPQAIEHLKGPIVEDKAIKFIFSKTKNTTTSLTIEKLLDLVKENEEKDII